MASTRIDIPKARRDAARLAVGAALFALAAGCAVGPDYKRPAMPVPTAFKENEDWKVAAPADDTKRGAWWEVFNDSVLNDMEAQVASSNFTIAEAVDNYDAAMEIAHSDRTGYLPFLGVQASGDRSRSPAGLSPTGRAYTASSFGAGLTASWEPDLWGRLRRTVEADVATAQADAADVALTRLSTQATLAQDYIQLRALDDQVRLLENALVDYRRTLSIAHNKYTVGVSARSDVITAQTQLDSTRAQLIGVGVQRAQYEHAIAVLLGKSPADFSIVRRPALGISVPNVPAVLPSSLLERRPDISAAERSAKAANARIGIQTSAYFPTLSLTGGAGYEESPLLDKLFTEPFKFWTLGASATDSLLDWGQRHDLVLSAKAAYEATVASYRQTVLGAFQQVEDNLAALRILNDEAQVERDAVNEATQASQIALNEYNAGTVDFTTVVTAQITELNNRETALGINQSQLLSSVALIQALGGGWSADELPRP